jgi:ABC-type antimicrobial peptide transport system permease subunit
MSYYSSDPKAPTALPDKYFDNKEVFSIYLISGSVYNIPTDEKSSELIDTKLKVSKNKKAHQFLSFINEGEYLLNELDKITGMSYDEFRNCGGVIYNNCNTVRDSAIEETVQAFPNSYEELTEKVELNIDDKKYTVVGVSASSEIQGILMPIENSASFNITYSISLRVKDHAHYAEAERLYNEFIAKANYDFSENIYMIGTGATEFINAIIKILIGFLVSIWLVGILSMINSVNTSVLNRSRELMMLRSVGMTRKQLRKSVMLETIMFSATAAVTGTALGVLGFIVFVFNIMHDKSPAIWGMVALIITISITVNIIISLIAAIPAIKNLGKVEAIAQAANG